MECSLLLHREVYHRGKENQMQEKKNNAKLQIVFSGLGLALVFILELYAMINLPEQFIVIGLLGVVLLAGLYVLIRAIMAFQAQKEVHREEQYDSIFKSEKASYLMLKKYFEEIEDKLEVIEKLSKLPTDEIVGTQKGIGKVIINRSRENAEAIINSNEIVMDEMKEIKGAIDSRNEALLDSCKSMNDDTVQQILLKQQDLLLELKNMELHLSNAIMQSQKNVAPAAVYAAPVMQQAPAPAPVTEPVVEEPMPVIEEPEPVVEEAAPVIEEPEPVVEEAAPVIEEPEPVVEEAAPVIEEPEPVVEEPAPVVEESAPAAAPEPDLSDPNKQLSPDEIAALFASMSDNGADKTPEPVVEEPAPVVEEPEPVVEEAAPVIEEPEPVVEEPAPVVEEPAPAAAPEPDLSDPNKQLSPDEIAALFASMTDEVTDSAPQPAVEEPPKAPEADLSDPNRQLSPDEIAALFSSMSS